MKVLEIKATLERSNPQVIRQLRVAEDTDFQTLHRILQTVIGWRDACEYEFSRGRTAMGEAAGTKHQNKQGAEACLPDSTLSRELPEGEDACTLYYRFGSGKQWSMRLMVSQADVPETEEIPLVIRFRGDNPPQACRDTVAFNKLQSSWKNYYYFKHSIDRNDYIFSLSETNLELMIQFGKGNKAEGHTALKVNLSLFYPLRDLLQTWTVADLKSLAARRGIRLPSGLRKHELIQQIAESFCSERLIRQCLEEMNLAEYRAFCDLCENRRVYTEANQEKYRTLTDFGYAVINDRGWICLARELVQSFLLMLKNGFEVGYMKYQQAKTCMKAGCMLYGTVTREVFDRLMEACYPGEQNPEDMESQWKRLLHQPPKEVSCLSNGIFYDEKNIREKDAKEWAEITREATRYLPDRETLEQIAAEGLMFHGETGRDVEQWLQRWWSIPKHWVRDYQKEIYRALRTGAAPADVIDWLNQITRRRKNNQYKAFCDYVGKLQSEVRHLGRLGFTDAEYAAQQKRPEKKQKIQPNDPCPCGSGRKYKYCCGRK